MSTATIIPRRMRLRRTEPCTMPSSRKIQARRIKEPSNYAASNPRSEEHTSELQSRFDIVCRLLLEKKKLDVQKVAQHPARDGHDQVRADPSVYVLRVHFFLNVHSTAAIDTLSLHDALPILCLRLRLSRGVCD